MTTHALNDGFRHAAGVLTTKGLALIAMTLCTLVGYKLHELSHLVDFDAFASRWLAAVSNAVGAATHMHEYAALLISPAAFLGCMALGGLYLWNQKGS